MNKTLNFILLLLVINCTNALKEKKVKSLKGEGEKNEQISDFTTNNKKIPQTDPIFEEEKNQTSIKNTIKFTSHGQKLNSLQPSFEIFLSTHPTDDSEEWIVILKRQGKSLRLINKNSNKAFFINEITGDLSSQISHLQTTNDEKKKNIVAINTFIFDYLLKNKNNLNDILKFDEKNKFFTLIIKKKGLVKEKKVKSLKVEGEEKSQTSIEKTIKFTSHGQKLNSLQPSFEIFLSKHPTDDSKEWIVILKRQGKSLRLIGKNSNKAFFINEITGDLPSQISHLQKTNDEKKKNIIAINTFIFDYLLKNKNNLNDILKFDEKNKFVTLIIKKKGPIKTYWKKSTAIVTGILLIGGGIALAICTSGIGTTVSVSLISLGVGAMIGAGVSTVFYGITVDAADFNLEDCLCQTFKGALLGVVASGAHLAVGSLGLVGFLNGLASGSIVTGSTFAIKGFIEGFGEFNPRTLFRTFCSSFTNVEDRNKLIKALKKASKNTIKMLLMGALIGGLAGITGAFIGDKIYILTEKLIAWKQYIIEGFSGLLDGIASGLVSGLIISLLQTIGITLFDSTKDHFTDIFSKKFKKAYLLATVTSCVVSTTLCIESLIEASLEHSGNHDIDSTDLHTHNDLDIDKSEFSDVNIQDHHIVYNHEMDKHASITRYNNNKSILDLRSTQGKEGILQCYEKILHHSGEHCVEHLVNHFIDPENHLNYDEIN